MPRGFDLFERRSSEKVAPEAHPDVIVPDKFAIEAETRSRRLAYGPKSFRLR